MQLRPYQEQAVVHAVDMLAERRNSLIVAGTGAGKTIMMAAAIGRYFDGFRATYNRAPHVLVLVHRTEIHGQNLEKFRKVCPHIPTSEITAERKSLHGYVHFGMVQTVTNLLPELERAGSYFDLIVIDEAHHSAASTYTEIIERNKIGKPTAALLGVTATPNRGDSLPLVELFDNFNQITTRFLVEAHYLVRPTFIDLTPTFRDKKGFEAGHLAKHCKDDLKGRELINRLCDEYLSRKEPGKSILFAPSHEFCQRIYDRLSELGRKPAYLNAGIDPESRREELERFEKGDSEELINVDICTEGYDFPELRNLVDFDTNGTHGQWVQKVGRVLRTAPGKTSCTVLDFGGNVSLYPEGVDADVLLEGVVKNPKGKRLTTRELFREGQESPETDRVTAYENACYTPYHLPAGFESVYDREVGTVYVACGENRDCIILKAGESYRLLVSDKKQLTKQGEGSFSECMQEAIRTAGRIDTNPRRISKMQIQLLAPEYSTLALDWYGANCCLCWKVWRKEAEQWT